MWKQLMELARSYHYHNTTVETLSAPRGRTMTDAPERIWVDDWNDVCRKPSVCGVEYVRADLYAALEQERNGWADKWDQKRDTVVMRDATIARLREAVREIHDIADEKTERPYDGYHTIWDIARRAAEQGEPKCNQL